MILLEPRNRNRGIFAGLILLTIVAGLLSRTPMLRWFAYAYTGDVLYGLMFYFIIGFCFARFSLLKTGLISFWICSAIELSQLCQQDWLVYLRSFRIGALILGFGFLWSDIICYFLGSLAGMLIELIILRRANALNS